MRFQQRLPLTGPREKLWLLLSDVKETAQCIPGVESVEATGQDAWAGVMKAGVGPVKVRLEGTVTLRERDEQAHRLVMALEANDARIGAGVQGVLTVSLGETQGGSTPLLVDADLTLLGKLAGLGQPIIRLKANDTLKQFAENLGKRLGR